MSFLISLSLLSYLLSYLLFIIYFNRDNNDLLKPEALAYEAALRNELLGTNITEIPVSDSSMNILRSESV